MQEKSQGKGTREEVKPKMQLGRAFQLSQNCCVALREMFGI